MVRETQSETDAAEQINRAWPSVTIYVLNWNGRSLLESCLPPLTQLDYPHYDIVLIDNHSEDDSVVYTTTTFPQITIIQNEDNIGFSKGMNVGLRQHQTDVAVLLNTDVEVRGDWLTELIRPIVADTSVGISGSKLYYGDGRTLQHAGVMMEYPLALGRHRFYQKEDVGQAETLCEVDYVTGASMAITKSVLQTIGCFDEDFSPFYYEESDFCLRAHAAGFKIVYAPKSVAIHHESMTFKKFSRPLFHNMNRNRLLFILKHLPVDNFLGTFVAQEKAFLKTCYLVGQTQTMQQIYLEMLLQLNRVLTVRSLQDQVDAYQDILVDLAQTAVTQTAINRQQVQLAEQAHLMAQIALQPHHFQSTVPLLGPLIARIRQLWGSVAAKWMVNQLIRQQNELNQLMIKQTQTLDARLIEQDNDLVALTRQLAETNITVSQMHKQLQIMHRRLADLEENKQ